MRVMRSSKVGPAEAEVISAKLAKGGRELVRQDERGMGWGDVRARVIAVGELRRQEQR